MPYTAADIAKLLEGELAGDGSLTLKGFAPADRAQPGDLTFAENENYFARAEQSAASVIIVDGSQTSSRKTLIRVPSARIAFAKVLPLFFPEPAFPAGIHPTAIVPASAQIDSTVHIGPYCVLGEQVRIGPRCVLEGANHVGARCQLEEDTRLFPNVTLYPDTQIGRRVRIHSGTVVGADGFGYVLDNGVHRKVPQIGNVIICDDVELGANVTVDRGALGPTIIGKGTKVDNLVQIAHNVTLGEHCIIVSQAGIAGSTKLGNYVVLGGQVGLAGHLKIGNRVSVAAQSGVMNNIPDGEKWIWTPAQPDRQAKRQMIALQQLPELMRRVKELEKKLAAKEEPAA
ncbi:MAG TPA: UDP-3-O-(3-hydroxymyristoyl)glucosamine N-acyltransferase [Candidatus Paceibacterota bacterium]|nr:UDP-3-O-(3-hydroxymyristoyl)glucosamine N-acyltransferase [Verrucomicrobiota bacterium]HSA09455.1 UDP-3-O-(3-hydroxymyristoyl)glucosamine N-acyltransferase [Candidatus Paceibacterota bacterium]